MSAVSSGLTVTCSFWRKETGNNFGLRCKLRKKPSASVEEYPGVRNELSATADWEEVVDSLQLLVTYPGIPREHACWMLD